MTKDKAKARMGFNRRYAAVAVGLTIAVGAGFAAVYGAGRLAPSGPAECRPAVDIAKRVAPLARGEVAAVQAAERPLRVPELAFKDAEGKPLTLAGWRGRTVLVNLWATWCVPCRKEMPALDELQAKKGNANFEVVAINIDTRDLDKPKQWLKDNGVTRLSYFADPSAAVFQNLKAVGRAFGMPTTLLIDSNGCEIASIAGPAEWASDDALKLIEAALKK